MNKKLKMTLKEFTEKYTQILNNCNADELRRILKNIAREVASVDRKEFIDKLLLQKSNNIKVIKVDEKFLQEIESLVEDVRSQAEEEPNWEFYYDEEDSLGEFSVFIPRLYEIFNAMEALFDEGNHTLLKKAFDSVCTIFDIEDDYGHRISIDDLRDLDIVELELKYLYSIYLTEQSMSRAKCLLHAMERLLQLNSYSKLIKLKDIINISINSLPDWSEFLENWIKITESKSELQYDIWYREAIYLQYGISGLEKLAKAEGKKRPRVYIDWVSALIDNKEYALALQASNVALEQLPSDQPIRATIGDLQLICGKALNNEEIQLNGQWITFEAKPDLTKLVMLYKQLDPSVTRQWMQRASKSIKTYKERIKDYATNNYWHSDRVESPVYPSDSLLMHTYLFSNSHDEAFELAQKGKSLGWSNADNPQPLFVGFCLARVVRKELDVLPISIKTLLNHILSKSIGWNSEKLHANLLLELEKIYNELLSKAPLLPSVMFDWCLKVAEIRIDNIVSNQYRQAYDRAALLTAACTETLKSINSDQAMVFFNKIKNKFSRHSAFQAELRQAMELVIK